MGRRKETINHPDHYGGADNLYEAIKVIDAWGLDFCLGNAIKYICRAGKKGNRLEDLRKAQWYLNHEIDKLVWLVAENEIGPSTVRRGRLRVGLIRKRAGKLKNTQRSKVSG